jgi:hypothetical protein
LAVGEGVLGTLEGAFIMIKGAKELMIGVFVVAF